MNSKRLPKRLSGGKRTALRWVLVLFLSTLAAPRLPAKDRFQKWIEEEVRWIASEPEVTEFKRLSSRDAKSDFIERFWKKRDPTPKTPINEYKDEYYRRWEFVNRQFREGMPGWRTDRGRVYLIHGPPDHIETLDRSGGNAYGLGDRSPAIVWKYSQLESPLDAWGATVLIFRAAVASPPPAPARTAPREGRPIITRSGSRQVFNVSSSVRYRLEAAGPPGLLSSSRSGSSPHSAEIRDVLRAPADLAADIREEKGSRLSELREQIDSAVHFDTLQVDMACLDFRGEGHSEVVVAWEWPRSQLTNPQSPRRAVRLDLVATLRDSEGSTVDEFLKTFEMPADPAPGSATKDQRLAYLGGFRVPPGDYEVLSLTRLDSPQKMGSAHCNLSIIPPDLEKVSASALVLSRGVVPEDGGEAIDKGFGEHLRWHDKRLFPHTSGVFSPHDPLILFVRIYDAQPVNEAPSVILSYQFLKDGQVYRSSGARKLEEYTDAARREIDYGSLVELADFEEGAYDIQVSVIDFHTRKFATRRAGFVVRTP